MKVILLGAGYATRLYPLTRERPKPLLPVAGVPILQRICEQIFKAGVADRIYVISNHRFVSHYYNWLHDFKSHRQPPVPIEIYDDMTLSNDDRLGAVGDIQFVIRNARIDDDLMIIAGDNLIQFDLKKPAEEAASRRSSVACLKDMKSKALVSLYGAVETDAEGRIIDFEEKPPKPRSTLVSIGVYVFAREHVPLVQRYLDEGHSKDQPGFYLQWLHKQIPVYGYVIDGDWFDIGDIDSYNKANEIVLKRAT